MKIVVTVKQVPATTAEKRYTSDLRLDRASTESIVNPLDEYAIEQALRLQEAAIVFLLAANDMAALLQIDKYPPNRTEGNARSFDDLAVRCIKKFWLTEQGKHHAQCCWRAAARFR